MKRAFTATFTTIFFALLGACRRPRTRTSGRPSFRQRRGRRALPTGAGDRVTAQLKRHRQRVRAAGWGHASRRPEHPDRSTGHDPFSLKRSARRHSCGRVGARVTGTPPPSRLFFAVTGRRGAPRYGRGDAKRPRRTARQRCRYGGQRTGAYGEHRRSGATGGGRGADPAAGQSERGRRSVARAGARRLTGTRGSCGGAAGAGRFRSGPRCWPLRVRTRRRSRCH